MTKKKNKNISKKAQIRKERKRLEKEIKRRILKHGNPRLQMFFILTTVFAAGFLSSYIMVRFDITSMPVRYTAAVSIAYLSFFGCLSVWVWLIKKNKALGALIDADPVDAVELGVDIISETGINPVEMATEAAHNAAGNNFSALKDAGDSDSSSFFSIFDIDLDDGAIFIIIALIAGALLVMSGYFIYTAPVFFTEILLDGLIAAGFYRNIKRLQADQWITSAFKKTWFYFLMVLLLYTIGGYIIQGIDPRIVTIGDAWKYI